MKLTILGCYSATPRIIAHTTSQVLETRGHYFLIDCGEGTQIELRRNKLKFNHIKHIFISHLHGDHYFGLIGLISTFRLLRREVDLNIYGPKGLKEIINLQLKLSNSWTNFKLIFHELDVKYSECIFEDDKVEVLHRGIAKRYFERHFTIADDVKVKGAELKNGLLIISLERVIPEHKKSRTITIK